MQIYLYLDILQIIYIYIVVFIANINFLQMEFKDRLKNLLDNVKIGGKRVTVYRIGKETPISMTSVNMYLKGSIPSYDKAKILADYFGVSVEWLMTGEDSPKIESNAELIPVPEFIEVPLVSQKVYAGYLSGYGDDEYLETLPTAMFIADHTPHGKYVAFDVKGDSMDDGSSESYREGDRVLCREVQMHLWADSKLHFKKWDFVIVHKEGILIKRIIEHDVEKKTITVHSLNPQYPDRVINLCDVKQILNVIQQMRPRMR